MQNACQILQRRFFVPKSIICLSVFSVQLYCKCRTGI
nr:MAG TPA: hypothetical protein [Caudoviricetes sp.]